MSAGMKYYEAEIERKFSIIFVDFQNSCNFQSSLQYLLPAQNVQVWMLTKGLKNTSSVKLVINWWRQLNVYNGRQKTCTNFLYHSLCTFMLLDIYFPSPGHFTTAAPCPLQTALLNYHWVPLINVPSHAGLQQLCDVCKRGKTGSEPHVCVCL